MPPASRNALVAGGVLILHVAALWALQTGLLRRAAEVVVPVELLAVMVEPPRAEAPPAPPAPTPPPPKPAPEPPVRKSAPAPRAAPRPAARPEPAPEPAPSPAPPARAEPQAAPAPVTEPVAAAAAPAPAAVSAPAAAAKVELPRTVADYLHNPAPEYPRMSFRLGEEGTSIVRVLVGPDGRPQDAQLGKSSGFARLDQAAVDTARSWRYVPGKRGGVPEAMWVNVPIRWEIKKE